MLVSLYVLIVHVFPISSHVFRCVCFVHQFSLDKLSSRFVKYMFVGYSWAQENYWCYDPNTRHYFASADVTFFKDILYYFNEGKSLEPIVLDDVP